MTKIDEHRAQCNKNGTIYDKESGLQKMILNFNMTDKERKGTSIKICNNIRNV